MNRGTSEEDLHYYKILRQIDTHRPRTVRYWEPRNIISYRVRLLSESLAFRVLSTLCIAVNAGFMLADHADASPDFEQLMHLQNQAFFLEIVFENVINLVGHGPKVFIHDSWKCFDFLIMLGSSTSYFSPDSKVSTGVQVCYIHEASSYRQN